MLNCTHILCSLEDDKRVLTITFFCHLQCWGYQPTHLFSAAPSNAQENMIVTLPPFLAGQPTRSETNTVLPFGIPSK
jgi:hypothetical protein